MNKHEAAAIARATMIANVWTVAHGGAFRRLYVVKLHGRHVRVYFDQLPSAGHAIADAEVMECAELEFTLGMEAGRFAH